MDADKVGFDADDDILDDAQNVFLLKIAMYMQEIVYNDFMQLVMAKGAGLSSSAEIAHRGLLHDARNFAKSRELFWWACQKRPELAQPLTDLPPDPIVNDWYRAYQFCNFGQF